MYIYVCVCLCVCVCVYYNIYAPLWGMSTLAKGFTAAALIVQSSSNELSSLVSNKV